MATGMAAATCFGGVSLLLVGRRTVRFLGKDDQLRVAGLTDTVVHNGPGIKMISPFANTVLVKAATLGPLDYAKIKDTAEGSEHVVRGPRLLFLGPYEQVVSQGKATSLTSSEYLVVEDRSTGEKRIEKGPKVFVPGPQESITPHSAISLTFTEFILVEDKLTGKRWVVKGPCIWFPSFWTEESRHKKAAINLSSTEYVLISDSQTGVKRIEKGPQMFFPGAWETASRFAGTSLSSTEYVLVEDSETGERRIQKGPCVWFPGPQETGTKFSSLSLSSTEYIHVEDKLTGMQSLVKGPCVWFPHPYDSPSSTMNAISLQDDEYIRVKDKATGKRWVQRGKALVFLEHDCVIEISSAKDSGVRKAWALKSYEYVRLINQATGKVTCHRGEATIFPEADEDLLDGNKLTAIDLKVNEYIKILDQATGSIRTMAGPKQVFLEAHDRVLDGGKQKAIEVDDEHAVLVRDKTNGQLRLVTEKKLFIPGPYESIEEVRDLIRLADHEALIIKDGDGHFHFYYGNEHKRSPDQPRAFFLPPYAEIVKLCWSRGRRRERRDLFIDRFDTRAQYMSFEFNCRTKDNVELVLEGTFFWEVVDLPTMVKTTGDTSGDICSHARSQFIKHVARVTLKEFMDDMNLISNKVFEEDAHFYKSRGVKVHSLEVTRYQCADQSTSEVLQQIIQETTNRMNRLSQAESENEVKLFKMQGQIEQEKLNGSLLEIQHEHSKSDAKVAGQAEADRVAAFMSGLADEVPKLEDRVAMWQTLRKTEALSVVSNGGASLFYTPNDVNLSIDTSSAKPSATNNS